MNSGKNLLSQIDVSLCDEVYLYGVDLLYQSHLRFKQGAKVDLRCAYNFPASLDVSLCDEIYLYGGDFSNLERLIFKNREQMDNSYIMLPQDWNGKVLFADVENARGGRYDVNEKFKSFARKLWTKKER